ncbi:hypothetical protein MMC20_003444 [Loxospora ochrophaea]|nr:hypothetical protein [Loxospora ochrophaea]
MEMALFSVLHLFAFPWKPYDVKRSEIVASESMPDFRPDPKSSYQGGPFGLYAYLDAFNPWDLVKAVGRSFRWLFVGRKIREQDSSYKSHLGGTGLDGAQGSNIPINHPYSGGKKYQPLTEEEDNERLLSHAQSNPSDNAYFPPSVDANPASGDIGAMGGRYTDPYSRQAAPDSLQAFHPTPGTLRRTENNGQESGVLAGEEDTAYHGATTQPPQYHIPPDPTLGRLGREGSWDVWGGMAGGDGKAGGGRGQFQEGQAF